MTPPSPCTGSIMMAAVSGPIACSVGGKIAERHLIEALDGGPEAFQVFRVAAGGDGGQRAAMEGAVEGDDAPALRVAADEVIAARGLDRRLAGFRARIAEEHLVGERRGDQPLGQPLLALDPIEVGRVPELAGLLGQRGDEARMRMAQAR